MVNRALVQSYKADGQQHACLLYGRWNVCDWVMCCMCTGWQPGTRNLSGSHDRGALCRLVL